MSEQELSRLVALQKVLGENFQADAEIVNNAEAMKELDGLNRDLLITRANAIQALLGIIQITVGLNISSMREAAPESAEPATETAPANEEETTEKGSEQE